MASERTPWMISLLEKMKKAMNLESLDEEIARMIERLAILRVSTKHINLWMRQLEMKRNEIGELAGLMGFDEIEKEIQSERDLEAWAKTCTSHFTKKTKRMLFEEVDNMVWSGDEKEIVKCCQRNKVYDQITEAEIEEIWMR